MSGRELKSKQGRPGKNGPANLAFFMPKASTREYHQRNGQGLRSISDPTRRRPPSLFGDGGRRADFSGANSVASAWASATGATPRRTTDGRGCQPRPNWKATEASVPGSGGPSLHQALYEGPHKEDLGIPRLRAAIAADATPPRQTWISPLEVRPLADRFQTTTRRNCFARSVIFM